MKSRTAGPVVADARIARLCWQPTRPPQRLDPHSQGGDNDVTTLAAPRWRGAAGRRRADRLRPSAIHASLAGAHDPGRRSVAAGAANDIVGRIELEQGVPAPRPGR